MIEQIYCCPRCKGGLEQWRERYECAYCDAVYPIIVGIPDFRVYSDPYIDVEADRAKGRYLAAEAERRDFAGLVAHYYSITPEVLPHQAERFTAHHLAGVWRGSGIVSRLEALGPADTLAAGSNVLDLGCGTAGFLAAVADTGSELTGIDIAFRWLVVGRHRLCELGVKASLVCACADYLPFPNDNFDLIVAENLLEHVPDAEGALAELERVRRPGSQVMGRTVNRFSLAPEPHVGVFGVGFLPRRFMNAYVRRMRGLAYEHIHLLSYFELRRVLQDIGQGDLQVQRAKLIPSDYLHHPPQRRRLFDWYVTVDAGFSPARAIFTVFGPFLDILSSGQSN